MVPTEIVAGGVAVLADAGAQTADLFHELFARQTVEILVRADSFRSLPYPAGSASSNTTASPRDG